MKNAIVLCSGGLDSVVAAYSIRKKYAKLIFLFFDYGLRALKEEEYCVKKIAKFLKADFLKLDLRWLGNLSNNPINKSLKFKKTTDKDLEKGDKDLIKWWVPCRNSVFLINALAFAESKDLDNKEKYDVIIGLKHEGRVFMNDTTEKFVNKFNELIKEATFHGLYRVIAPLIKLDKPEVVGLGKKLKVHFEFTYSCYIGAGFKEGKAVHCGRCLNCALRKKGFYWSGIKDESLYKE